MMRQLFIVLVMLFMSGLAFSQSVSTYVVPDSLTSGDTFNLIITSQYQDNQFRVLYPGESDFKDPFEFRSFQRYRGTATRDSIVYRIQFFGVRDTVISSMPVYFVSGTDTLVLSTVAIPIFFRSNLTDGDTSLMPLKPIFDFARSWFWIIILVAVVAIMLYFLWKHRKIFIKRNVQNVESEPKEIPPFRNPFLDFDSWLQSLRDMEKHESDNFKQWHIILGNLIRQYYETAHNIPALESTTKEFLTLLYQHKFPSTQTDLIKDILRRCDMVKFAKYSPDLHATISIYEKAEKLRDIIRFQDEYHLRQMKVQYEIQMGLRPSDSKTSEPTPSVITRKED